MKRIIIREQSAVEQLVRVPASTTETLVKITVPLPFPIEQSGGTPIANKPPVVNAGQDQEITLPTNRATLRGIGFDSDGDVVSYRWQQVAGTAGAIIDNTLASQTIVSGLVADRYVFRLTVTDNEGLTAYDDITIDVLDEQTPNEPPQVSAGQDVTITLPTNSVLLDGTASDFDGTIVSYLWSKVSGGSATFQNPNVVDTLVTGLIAGTYIFQLEVIDDKGAKSFDQMQVTVKPSEPIPNPSKAEGFGALATGGANSSTVYHVTNLNKSGSGSLAAGIGSNKTIVFDVSGKIVGRFDLVNISYLTIDASGQDITIDNNNNGNGISFENSNTHHCIIRNLNVTNAGMDGINVVDGAHDILIDHCSSYGNRDGNIDVAGGEYVTIQNSLFGGGGDNGSGDKWSGAGLVTAKFVTIHHCLLMPVTQNGIGERCVLVHCSYSPPSTPNCDFRNNVVYKWGRNGGTGSGYATCSSYGANTNAVGNYYYSNASPSSACVRSAYGEPKGNLFASLNISGNSGVNPNAQSNHDEWPIPSEYQVTLQPACEAAQFVFDNVAPRPLNAVNKSYIDQIKSFPACNVAADETKYFEETSEQEIESAQQ